MLEKKIDTITDVSDFTPDGYDKIDGYENQIKEYVKSKIGTGKDNINFNKISLKSRILGQINEKNTLAGILKLLKYSDTEINELKKSISEYLKEKEFNDKLETLVEIDVKNEDIEKETDLYVVEKGVKKLIYLGNFQCYEEKEVIDENENNKTVRTGVKYVKYYKESGRKINGVHPFVNIVRENIKTQNIFYKPKPNKAGKRKSRRNRKSKKGKKSRKARKSRRKSNRRR